jgi:hypothetical protein
VTNLKDKLSASVRMAKAAQQSADQPAPESPAPPEPAAAPATAKKSAGTGVGARPPAAKSGGGAAPAETGPKAPAKTPPTAPAGSSAGEIPESGSTLFPERIWPD